MLSPLQTLFQALWTTSFWDIDVLLADLGSGRLPPSCNTAVRTARNPAPFPPSLRRRHSTSAVTWCIPPKVYAGAMLILYPIGIPDLYGTILFKHHDVLKDRRRRSVQQSTDLEMTRDLWKPYTPAQYYYAVVECARWATPTGVVVFIYPNTAAQVAVTLLLVFVFVMVSAALAPYASKQDSWLSRVAHIVVFLSMFQALALKIDVSDESSVSQEVFAGVLSAANVCMVVAVIAEATMVVCSLCTPGDAGLEESVTPGVRNTTGTRSVIERWAMIEGDAAPTDKETISHLWA